VRKSLVYLSAERIELHLLHPQKPAHVWPLFMCANVHLCILRVWICVYFSAEPIELCVFLCRAHGAICISLPSLLSCSC